MPASPIDVSLAETLSLQDVRKTFGTTAALNGVSFTVRKGEMFGLIGPDGAGKTTLLRLACGLLAPTAGTVRLFGSDPFRTHRAATSSVGYLPQRFSLYGDLSIDENIEFFARLHGVTQFAALRTRLLGLTGLTRFRDRLAERLSGGMKQKLALACTLVHEPPLLVLDEPTTGVDPVSRREFWKLLAEFRAQGLTIVLATPYLDEAERCGRVALLHEGRLLALDDPARLQRELSGTILEIVTSTPRQALEALRQMLGPDRVQLFGDRLHAHVDDSHAGAAIRQRLVESGFAVTGLRPILPSLEDVFIDLLAGTQPQAAEPPIGNTGTQS